MAAKKKKKKAKAASKKATKKQPAKKATTPRKAASKKAKASGKKAKARQPKKAKAAAPKAKAVVKKAKAVVKKAKAVAKPKARAVGAVNGSEHGHVVIALPGRKSRIEVGGAYKGANLDHHPVSKRDLDDVARQGLRGEGAVLHGEEADFAPCRLVDQGDGRFSLCLDDFRMPPRALFEERGLQGGGYTWEAVVASLVKLRRPDLVPKISYDSESGMFVALGDRESLRAVAKLIQQAIASESVLRESVDAADPDRLE